MMVGSLVRRVTRSEVETTGAGGEQRRSEPASRSYSMRESRRARAGRMASRAELRQGAAYQKSFSTRVTLGPEARKTRGRFSSKGTIHYLSAQANRNEGDAQGPVTGCTRG